MHCTTLHYTELQCNSLQYKSTPPIAIQIYNITYLPSISPWSVHLGVVGLAPCTLNSEVSIPAPCIFSTAYPNKFSKFCSDFACCSSLDLAVSVCSVDSMSFACRWDCSRSDSAWKSCIHYLKCCRLMIVCGSYVDVDKCYWMICHIHNQIITICKQVENTKNSKKPNITPVYSYCID